LITAAVLTTQQIQIAVSALPPELISYVQPTPPALPAQLSPAVAPLPPGFEILIAPMHIPDVLPAIDPSRAITDPGAYTGVGVPGGIPDGVAGAPLPGTAFTSNQVERVAQLVAGTGTPQYPETLRSAGLEGDVVVEFVIDTTGRADLRTIRIVSSTHQRFTESAMKALSKARFLPAELGGRRVPQLVRMPFGFKLKQ